MRKILLSALSALLLFSAKAQTVSDFETQPLSASDTYFINMAYPMMDVGFEDGAAHFPYVWDSSFGGYWGYGFSYSNMTDSVTSGYLNQYAAKAGSGYGGLSNYAIFWQGYGGNNYVILHDSAMGNPVQGFYITNTTYAYNNMRDGGFPAKKFGGTDGTDPDFFLLTIKGFSGGTLTTDSVDFYLADYRFTDSTMDYLVKDWQWVDLTSLGDVDSLSFFLSSSDNGSFGMNTPAYFAMDNFTANVSAGIHSVAETTAAKIYPVPTVTELYVDRIDATLSAFSITDMNGKVVMTGSLSDHETISVRNLNSGNYLLHLSGNNKRASAPFVKK